MNKHELVKRIMDTMTDFDFTYKGHAGGLCPYNDECIIGWEGGRCESLTFPTLREALHAPIFDGKCLLEIVEEIEY